MGSAVPDPGGLKAPSPGGSSLVWAQWVPPSPWSSHAVPRTPGAPGRLRPEAVTLTRPLLGASACPQGRGYKSPQKLLRKRENSSSGDAQPRAGHGGKGRAWLSAARPVVPAKCRRGALDRCLTPRRRRRPDNPARQSPAGPQPPVVLLGSGVRRRQSGLV